MKTCVIGGGLMGMALARKLAADGHAVTVLERDEQLGGLATYHDFGGFYWDRFYHVILPSDQHLIKFIDDLGLSDHLEWRRTYTGFYVDGQLHSISSNFEFLRFPLLPLHAKIRLAWMMIYCSQISDWRRLEQVPVEEWLIRISGRQTYEKLWKPLLLAKLGENYKRVSAVFIWSYIRRLFSARDKSASAEQLGHVDGGYKLIFERLQRDIIRAGGVVRKRVEVLSIRPSRGRSLVVETASVEDSFDNVICTSPHSVLQSIIHPDMLQIENANTTVEYLGVICVVIVSSQPIVPFYVVNIADEKIPFTGVIGMSTVIDPRNTGNRYLTYLPKYVLSTADDLKRSDDDVRNEFMKGVRAMVPDFDMNSVESVHVNRAFKVQPLQVLDYSKMVPQITTKHPGLYILNTSQFVNATLNNNEVIGAVNNFFNAHRETLNGERAERGRVHV